jgi:hypothetical protein
MGEVPAPLVGEAGELPAALVQDLSLHVHHRGPLGYIGRSGTERALDHRLLVGGKGWH